MQIDIEAAKKQICRLVVDDMDFEREMTEEEIYEAIDNALMRFEDRDNLSLTDELILRNEAYNSLRKYDVIQEYLDDEEVTEIMINGEKDIFIEKRGVIEKSKKVFESKEKLEDVIQAMVAGCNRAVNEASPIQDARLSNGERVNIVLSPIAINGPIVTIRRFPNDPITMERLVEYGSISEEASDFLKRLVESKYNIFISGGTGTGKTTFLNALSQYIPKEERIITIEDSAELQLLEAENIVRLETRNAVSDECTNISIRDLIKSALRMRPDRVIVCTKKYAKDTLKQALISACLCAFRLSLYRRAFQCLQSLLQVCVAVYLCPVKSLSALPIRQLVQLLLPNLLLLRLRSFQS